MGGAVFKTVEVEVLGLAGSIPVRLRRAPLARATVGRQMSRYVLLVRGVNVGGRQRLAMADLRRLLEGLGYTGVATALQSGNAVLTADGQSAADVAAAAEAALAGLLPVQVLCRSAAELADLVAANPLADVATDPSRYLVVFLAGQPAPDRLAGLDPDWHAPDVYRVGDRALYQWCPGGQARTRLTQAFWERRLGTTATVRNWSTVTRLLAMATEGG